MLARLWATLALVSLVAAAAWERRAGPVMEPPAVGVARGQEAVDFDRDVRPLLEGQCWKCHGASKQRSGLRLDSRDAVLKGGDSGPAAVEGHGSESLLVKLVSGGDPDRVMPDKGPRLEQGQIDLLRRWIDEGVHWGSAAAASAAKAPVHKYELALKPVALPAAAEGDAGANAIDRLLRPYFQVRGVDAGAAVDDRAYARRVYLDVVGLVPTPDELAAFLADGRLERRGRLVDRLLHDQRRYAEHWLTFWNDALRNDYRGVGYIDGGREQITQWLFDALYNNTPYDRFVSELIDPPSKASVGFTKGIVWRGVVNASQIPPMQAAQNISQVFLGLNLKCASCHDSFINDWKLADAYSLAAVFADGPLELSRCDRPTGTMARAGFLYPELGSIEADAPKADRLKQLNALLIQEQNGRFTRTIVNRLWAKLLGRGIVEPVDEMDNAPWSGELLDFLAADLIDHGYDLKRTLELILTSRAYQLPSVAGAGGEELAGAADAPAPFTGPAARRMTAEQFVDAVRCLTGVWPVKADAQVKVGSSAAAGYPGPIRAGLLVADPLMMALGRPNREQVVTSRSGTATTLQAIELTIGAVLDGILKQGAQRWVADAGSTPGALVTALFARALGREPTGAERERALEIVGDPVRVDGVQDLLWVLTMLPEFQLIR
jgi:hypothetical protein